MRHLLPFIVAIALLAGGAASPALAQGAPSQGHAHAGAPVALAPLAVGEWSITVTGYDAPRPRAEYDVDIAVKGPAPFPKALRAWIGDETGDLTGKTRIDSSGHGHLLVPDPLDPAHRLWIEVEDEAGRKRGSIALSPADAGPGHAHPHPHPAPVSASIASTGEGAYHLQLAGEDGKPLGGADLQATHGAPIHLVIVDASLTDLRHLHPVEAAPGKWALEFTPRLGGAHRVVAETTPTGAAGAVFALAEIAAPGAAGSFDATPSATAERGGITFELAWDAEPVAAHDASFAITASTDSGEAPALEPVLGAAAHVFVLGPDATDFTHVHAETGNSASAPLLAGSVSHATPGPKRLFVHLKVAGQEHIVPFTYAVASDDHGHDHGDGHGHDH